MVKNISLLAKVIAGFLGLMLGQFNVEDYWSLIIEPVFPTQKNWRGYNYLILTVFAIELILLYFPAGSGTGIHDHRSLVNPNIVLFGEIQHTVFNVRNGKLRNIEECLIKAGQGKWLVKYQIHTMDVPLNASTPALMLNIHFPARNNEITK